MAAAATDKSLVSMAALSSGAPRRDLPLLIDAVSREISLLAGVRFDMRSAMLDVGLPFDRRESDVPGLRDPVPDRLDGPGSPSEFGGGSDPSARRSEDCPKRLCEGSCGVGAGAVTRDILC